MTDIVKQLRFGNRQLENWEIMLDAAREIERLREEVELWKDRCESVLRDAQHSEATYQKQLNEGG